MTIHYVDTLADITEAQLAGLCGSWDLAPSTSVLLRLLAQAPARVLAVEEGTGAVVGFLGVVPAPRGYMPLTDVLPAYQDLGVAAEMRRRVLTSLAPGQARYPRAHRAIA
ncbi:MAG: family N-acetyltransferase [Cyanobacteria bacterium RYN_339]|nr:family N-acetyltransferase [Cyanobacteria bacterium RYN_339]